MNLRWDGGDRRGVAGVVGGRSGNGINTVLMYKILKGGGEGKKEEEEEERRCSHHECPYWSCQS